MTSSWYGKASTRELEKLLQTKPKLLPLLNFNDFIQQLKSYNTKLLDYVTNNPSLIGQAIQFLINAPSINDTYQRKFKYPLLVIQMIETQTTCVLNSFFKETSTSVNNNLQYFDYLFNILQQADILPLLAGYFFRTNITLLNNRYKETLDRIYVKPFFLTQLLNHAHLMPIVNTIQLYLNLDMNKSAQSDPGRLQVKKDLLKKILTKIETQRKLKRADSSVIIENLMTVLIETIEKYYLILDGKILIQILTSQQCIQIMLALIKENWQGSHPAFNFFISLINYYSFSSFNSDETDPDKKIKNLQRLQAQPMVIGLKFYFPIALDKIAKASLITLYEYKLLEVLCHCISISSEELLKIIKEKQFFGCLINLMFKHEENNILHMLIEKSFLHVFISERKIYDQYKRHLFCELDIIQLTASRVLATFGEDKIFEKFKKKVYFGHFMRILKIYSGIQTTEEMIINSIKSKTQVWNRISTNLIKPYESICFKQLGSYDNVPQGKCQEFEVVKPKQELTLPLRNPKPLSNSMIEEIRKQDLTMPLKKQQNSQSVLPTLIKDEIILQRQKQQQLLKAPTHNFTIQFKPESGKQIKKVESFKQFMSKKKVEAQKQIKLKRSLSHQKRLSGSKGKISNASPKKNSWTQKTQQNSQSDSTSQSLTINNKSTTSSLIDKNKSSEYPKIPHYTHKTSSKEEHNEQLNSIAQNVQSSASTSTYRSYYGNSIQNRQSPNSILNGKSNGSSLQTKSDKNLQIIKKIKVIQIEAPKEKRYRKLEQKDKILLDFLGITSGVK